MIRRYLLITLSIIMVLSACKEKELQPISQGDGKPGPVVIDHIENIPGGARISFTIPDSKDLMMVQAVYTTTDGEQKTSIASKYQNQITLTGYNDTDEHDVVLYAMNVAMQASDPVSRTFQPLKSPLKMVEESMQIIPGFGGARFQWENLEKAPITVDLLAADDDGSLKLVRIFSTNSSSAYQALRGYEPEPRVFAAVVRDAFGNTSDSIFPAGKSLVPILELEVDKKDMRMLYLNGDGDFSQFDMHDYAMFDGNVNTFAHSAAPPAVFTFDLGTVVKLSRFKMWNRLEDGHYYHWGNPRFFKIYGRTEAPSQNGNWDEWILLADCEEIKPSGLPNTKQSTVEDVAFAVAGFEFEIDFSFPSVRYVRFSIEETWSKTSYAHPAEFSFYGQFE